MDAEKIIFLDVDGVLNDKDSFPGACCKKVQLLKYIIQKTGAKIVLSSAWRYSGIDKDSSIYEQFMKGDPKGIVCGALIDSTPKPGFIDPPMPPNHIRGHEIQRWIEDNDYQGKFVILDDEDDMGDLTGHLIKTDKDVGLLRSHVDKVIKALK